VNFRSRVGLSEGKLGRMSELKTYAGGCACGRVRYEAQMDLGQPVISCNCSMCGRAGTLLSFIQPSQFTLTSGEDALAEYKFNKHVISHLFCKTCGIKPFARGSKRDGTPMVAINVRCLDGVELEDLTITKVDGRSWA
jgi:hypothetical protein